MVRRSLLAVWLIALLSLSSLSATDRSPAGEATGWSEQAFRPRDNGITVPFDDYWNLVAETQQAVGRMKAEPAAAVRQELETVAAQWEQITAVENPDRSVLQIDSSYLAAELRHDPPDLERLTDLLAALLHAHEQYPQKVFTPEDAVPLQAILARPEFQWQQAAPTPDWLARLNDFINQIIERIATMIYEGRIVFEIAAALLFLLALFFISRGLSRSLVREAELDAEGDGNDEFLSSQGAFKRAETLSMQGDYRNAIRYLYLSSLLVLDEQGVMRYDRSRTNREYLRSVSAKPELAKPLRDVIEVFDRVWYGYEGIDEPTYRSYVQRVDELREKKE